MARLAPMHDYVLFVDRPVLADGPAVTWQHQKSVDRRPAIGGQFDDVRIPRWSPRAMGYELDQVTPFELVLVAEMPGEPFGAALAWTEGRPALQADPHLMLRLEPHPVLRRNFCSLYLFFLLSRCRATRRGRCGTTCPFPRNFSSRAPQHMRTRPLACHPLVRT